MAYAPDPLSMCRLCNTSDAVESRVWLVRLTIPMVEGWARSQVTIPMVEGWARSQVTIPMVEGWARS